MALPSQPASAQSAAEDVLSQLEAEVGTAVAAANVGGTDPQTFYVQIAKGAKQLLALIKAGPSACRTSLGAAQRLQSELTNKSKLKADVLLAQSGLLNCGVVILKGGPTPVPGTTVPPTEPPSVVVVGFSETVTTKAKTAKFGGTEVDHRALTGQPRAGDPGSCSKGDCEVELVADTRKTSDISASNQLVANSPCSYSHSFASSVSNDGIGGLSLHYNQDGKLTSADVRYGPTVGIGGLPTGGQGPSFLFSCIYLLGQNANIERNVEEKSVTAAILAEGNAFTINLEHSGSVLGKGFYGDGAKRLRGPLTGTLNYTATTRITFRLAH